MHSFAEAVGLRLKSTDYALFVDPQVVGRDRDVAVGLLKLMPPTMRGDFVYVTPTNERVLSNRAELVRTVQFQHAAPSLQILEGVRSAQGIKTLAAYPPSGGPHPHIRHYSVQNVNAGTGYATVPCDSRLTGADTGQMYFNAYDGSSSSGSVVDAGIEVRNNSAAPRGFSISAFVNIQNSAHYLYSGWNSASNSNEGTWTCGQPLGIMYGTISNAAGVPAPSNNLMLLDVGVPQQSPYDQALPPSQVTWVHSAWTFWSAYGNAPGINSSALNSLFNFPGQWEGVPSTCTQCSVAKMTALALDTPGDCFGACNGLISARWDQVVMGELIQPCDAQQNDTMAECTIQYGGTVAQNGTNSWYGGVNDNIIDPPSSVNFADRNWQYWCTGNPGDPSSWLVYRDYEGINNAPPATEGCGGGTSFGTAAGHFSYGLRFPAPGQIKFVQIAGNSATDISIGVDASVYYVGTTGADPGNYHVYRLNGTTPTDLGITGDIVAGGINGDPWVLKANGSIYHFANGAWNPIPSNTASDIAVGGDGSVYYVGTTPADAGNYHVYRLNGTVPTDLGITATHVSGGGRGDPWVMKANGAMSHFVNGGWNTISGNSATAISAGADGNFYYAGTTAATPGEYHIYQLSGTKPTDLGIAGDHVAGGPKADVWVLNAGAIYHGTH